MEVANSQLVAASIRCGSLTLGNIRFFLEMKQHPHSVHVKNYQ